MRITVQQLSSLCKRITTTNLYPSSFGVAMSRFLHSALLGANSFNPLSRGSYILLMLKVKKRIMFTCYLPSCLSVENWDKLINSLGPNSALMRLNIAASRQDFVSCRYLVMYCATGPQIAAVLTDDCRIKWRDVLMVGH